jgi:hypothetical protein
MNQWWEDFSSGGAAISEGDCVTGQWLLAGLAEEVAGRDSGRQGQWLCISIAHRADPLRVAPGRFSRGSGRQGQWQAGTVALHLDSAPSHTSLVVQQLLSSSNHRILLTSLFPALRMGLKGTRFATMEDMKSMRQPNAGRFQKKASAGTSNNSRVDRARVCAGVCVGVRARAQGSYFEGD